LEALTPGDGGVLIVVKSGLDVVAPDSQGNLCWFVEVITVLR
jgi:hypothetical protein